MTLTALLEALSWIGTVVFAGLVVSAMTFVFSKEKKPKLRKHAQWWAMSFGLLIVLLMISVGVISEQIAVASEQFTK